ncbi:MAG: bifunctional phosphoglucose/phosphomannose isomerase [Bacteroidota bacterium]
MDSLSVLVDRHDDGGMYALIRSFPAHLREGRRRALEADLTWPEDPAQVVIVGMGGSAIGGDLVASMARGSSPVPVEVVRGYTVPGYVNACTVVIVSSFSGNTEETLSAFDEAVARGATILCVTSGGTVQARAEAGGYGHVLIPGGMPPRAALGYSFSVVATLAERLGVLAPPDGAWEEAYALLDAQTEDLSNLEGNQALDLARQLTGAVPLVYSGNGLMEVVNLRWRGQIQENSKVLAFGNVFPELNHNEIMGWTYPDAFIGRLAVIVLRDRADHPRVLRRLDITGELLQDRAALWHEVHSRGESALARLLATVNLGDWVSYYLAVTRQVDPTPIGLIDALKTALG